MTPYNPLEERLQALEAGPCICPECRTPYNSQRAADACCRD